MNIKSIKPNFGSAFVNLFIDNDNKSKYVCSWEVTNDNKGDIFYNFSKIAEAGKIKEVSTNSDISNLEKLRNVLLSLNEIKEPEKNTSRGKENPIDSFFTKKDLIINELISQFNKLRFPESKN